MRQTPTRRREGKRGKKGRSSRNPSDLQMRYVDRSCSSWSPCILNAALFHLQYAVFVSMHSAETKVAMPELKGNQIWQYMGAQWRQLSRVRAFASSDAAASLDRLWHDRDAPAHRKIVPSTRPSSKSDASSSISTIPITSIPPESGSGGKVTALPVMHLCRCSRWTQASPLPLSTPMACRTAVVAVETGMPFPRSSSGSVRKRRKSAMKSSSRSHRPKTIHLPSERNVACQAKHMAGSGL